MANINTTKSTRATILIAIGLGLSIWVADAVADYWLFYRGQSFWDLLILDPPPHEIYIRLLILFVFFVFGIVVSRRLRREQRIMTDLTEAIKEKDLLLRELHHRVKNNLSMIMSMTKLKSGQATSDAEIESLESLYSRINSIALIHKHLYRRDSVSYVELDVYVDRLAEEVFSLCFATNPDIRLETQTQPIRVPLDIAVPCGLVINELIHNSCKHAFVDLTEGAITIELRRFDRGFELIVSDSGVGATHQTIDQSRPTSLGLTLVEALSNQIDGSVTFETDHGFRTTMTVPQVPEIE